MTGIGYSVARGESEENGALVPLLEKLVQLVEQRGTEGFMDEGGDSESEGNAPINVSPHYPPCGA